MSSAAGEHRGRRDCAVVALQLATGKTYEECHAALGARGRKTNRGTHTSTLVSAGHDLGFVVSRLYLKRTDGPKRYTMKTIGDALKPTAKYIIFMHDHFAAFVDGEVRDWSAGSNRRVKWVYEVRPRLKVWKRPREQPVETFV
jgi:hypothetical protein